MNKLFYLLSVMFLLLSCAKPEHKIRVKNDYTEDINSLAVGDAIFDKTKMGTTTQYKPIDKGTFSIDGRTSTSIITGTGKIRGRGKHFWTLTFNQSGKISINEDK
ncbi:MAG: hypothetical protein LCH32_10715 [Bacteroidetes bacterium]|nr:hypothetical protein [Bacteroidota bacterium]